MDQEEEEERRPVVVTDTWMVSDVVAYPERIIELLEWWCGGHWARFMVVTMKF